MKILVATDGSDTARMAVEFLANFPLPQGTDITVVTVLREVLAPADREALPDAQRKTYEDAREAAELEAGQHLEEAKQRLEKAGHKVSTLLRTGHAAEEIVRVATELKADIITVGSHGLSGIKRFLLGSVSDRVFEYAPCSVLIVKPPGAFGAQAPANLPAGPQAPWRLLLAYDDSPPARKAVEFCAALPLHNQVDVKAITVLPLIKMFRQDVRQQLSWVWKEKKQAAEMALQWLTNEVGWKTHAVATELVESPDVSQAILDAAKDFQSDLVVVGHKGKKAFERFLRGSVTARIAHHAGCSVLSVR